MALTRTQSIALLLASVGTLVGLVVAGWWQWEHRARHAVLIFMDVGQGDATLLAAPGGQQLLVDCGRSGDLVLPALGRNMPYFDRTIENLIVTHADTDHYAGCIDVLARYHVQHVYYNGIDKPNDAVWQKFIHAMSASQIEPAAITTTTVWRLPSVEVHSLFPDVDVRKYPDLFGAQTSDNNRSVILRIDAQPQSFLLTGDAEEPLERYLVARMPNELHAHVLKAGHHGSKTSSSEAFLQTVGASLGVISVGAHNSYGHPSPRVIARLQRYGIRVRRTDLEGDIRFVLY